MERIGRLIRKLKGCRDSVTTEELARAAWPMAVGPRIGLRTQAAVLVRSKLVVQVEDEVWRRQLFGLRFQILNKLNEVLGPGIVDQLEFRVIPRRIGPQSVELPRAARAGDEISDPILRRIYRAARKKEIA